MSATLRQIITKRRQWYAAIDNDLGVPDYGINRRPIPPAPVFVPAPPPPEPPKYRWKNRTAWNPRKAFGDYVMKVGALVAQHHGLAWRTVLSKKREHRICEARHMAIAIASTITARSQPYLGNEFGVDASVCHYAIEKVKRRSLTEFMYGSELAALECSIVRKLEKRC